jgi:hypothetical protein
VFGAPACWSIALLASFAVTAHACYPKNFPRTAPAFSGMWTIAVLINGFALCGALWAGATALASWRAASEKRLESEHGVVVERARRARFMGYAGMLTSCLFVLAIAVSGVALFILPACTYGN